MVLRVTTEGKIATECRQPTFAAILDGLCRAPAGHRNRYTNTELAQIINDLGGDITDGYISHLRKGHRDNPTLQTVEYLATALDVSPAAFIEGRRERKSGERPRASFSAKLGRLFAVVYPTGRKPYTPEEVASSISRDNRFGSISPSYIRELLAPPSASLPNPRLKHILGLAEYFKLAGDSPRGAYFLDDELAETVDDELADFVALRNAGVLDFVHMVSEEKSDWSLRMRRQAVEFITHALETADTDWNFSFRQMFPDRGTGEEENSTGRRHTEASPH
ncbi:helix-turn-helix domain-containing protein [Allosalinactinospora lopnorensis]|uniref:helix-turn-helix domain-containing protein n=1 Tax=Allosalinactinospora lopnorensis TaxID=1352348 RepID=UPI0012E13E40|nr:hypothetical protein [Allosalinactinospora lopnorensis]